MKKTVKEILERKGGEKIAVLTAFDYLTAGLLDAEDIDIILVGDSLGMVSLGYDSTVPVTMRDMLHHTKAVCRAVKKALVVADMPFGSYETPERALRNARRFLQEAGADAVKLEGGKRVEKQIELLVQSGVPVMGHLGLTPQTASQLGGYRVQGREVKQAEEILEDARLLSDKNVFSMVLECIPAKLAEEVTRQVSCPTIGIGAGAGTDGQVLVVTDMLGFRSSVAPKFVRTYASLDTVVRGAVRRYRDDVKKSEFPSPEESYQ